MIFTQPLNYSYQFCLLNFGLYEFALEWCPCEIPEGQNCLESIHCLNLVKSASELFEPLLVAFFIGKGLIEAFAITLQLLKVSHLDVAFDVVSCGIGLEVCQVRMDRSFLKLCVITDVLYEPQKFSNLGLMQGDAKNALHFLRVH